MSSHGPSVSPYLRPPSCEDLKHKRKVAVKVLRPELAAVLEAERLVQEINTTANLQHPHIFRKRKGKCALVGRCPFRLGAL